MQSISSALQQFQSRSSIYREMRIARAWMHWEEILGSHLAQMAKPLGKKKNVLILGAPDSIVLQELSYYTEHILQELERFLGWKAFDKIRFELLQDRTALDQIRLQQPRGTGNPTETPEDLGGLSGNIPGDSVIASCYRAYLRCMRQRKDK